MAETLTQAFKAVEKYAATLNEKFIEVMHVRSRDTRGKDKPDEFKAYIPGCGYQQGNTITELMINLKAEFEKRGGAAAKAEADKDLDLPF